MEWMPRFPHVDGKRNQGSARPQATILLHGTRSLIFHILFAALVEGLDLLSLGSEAGAGV